MSNLGVISTRNSAAVIFLANIQFQPFFVFGSLAKTPSSLFSRPRSPFFSGQS